jgi:hypothetical protein
MDLASGMTDAVSGRRQTYPTRTNAVEKYASYANYPSSKTPVSTQGTYQNVTAIRRCVFWGLATDILQASIAALRALALLVATATRLSIAIVAVAMPMPMPTVLEAAMAGLGHIERDGRDTLFVVGALVSMGESTISAVAQRLARVAILRHRHPFRSTVVSGHLLATVERAMWMGLTSVKAGRGRKGHGEFELEDGFASVGMVPGTARRGRSL